MPRCASGATRRAIPTTPRLNCWPQRPTNFFGKLGYENSEAQNTQTVTSLQETLQALEAEIQKGRIRYIGLSNETPWGTMKFLQIAEQLGMSKFVSVQNKNLPN